MDTYSDSDTSSESSYESSQESVHESDCDDENENLEPEPDVQEFDGALWDPQAQLHATQLLELYRDIKVHSLIALLIAKLILYSLKPSCQFYSI